MDGGLAPIGALIYIIYLLVVYSWLIITRAGLSWFPVRPGSRMASVKRVLHVLTEPYLRLFRRLLPQARIGPVGLDVSALVGLIVLVILIQVLARLEMATGGLPWTGRWRLTLMWGLDATGQAWGPRLKEGGSSNAA